jgi:hypothetical protein
MKSACYPFISEWIFFDSYEAFSFFSIFSGVWIGLSSGTIPASEVIGWYRNSYAILDCVETEYYLAGEPHDFQLPEGAIRPEMKEYGNVFGCGLVLDPENKFAIFFTLNGQLLGEFYLDGMGIGDEWTGILNS